MTDIERYVDSYMFPAEPMRGPGVYLLNMTADPLGAIAAACRMYEGKPTYNLGEVTDDERRHYWAQVQATHLQAPLEFVQLHFFLEGVDRAFTHQMVRQRTAVYAQESLRFAVKEGFAQEAVIPPSVMEKGGDIQEQFETALAQIELTYNQLVANGIPAEDARALLPHCVATRLHYCTNLRNLVDHAGNRLCTQAQFHWRQVFGAIVRSIINYPNVNVQESLMARAWQFEMIATSNLFKPVCYAKGHCPFQASFDRGCTIRPRVEAFAKRGIPSTDWDKPWGYGSGGNLIDPIRTEEWALDPKAAWQ
jgi:flavin-dependent thymidylate synthase